MARPVSNEELASHKPRVERLAQEIGARPGVDLDDLVQEGWMYVFEGLRKDHQRTDDEIRTRMRRWSRRQAQQRSGWVPLDENLLVDEDG